MQEILEYIKNAFDLKSQKCYKQAIEMLYKALEIENDNIEILFHLGELYFLLNNFPRASHYLEKVLSKNENHIESLKILKTISEISSDYDTATELAERIYNINGSSKNLTKLINCYAKLGRIDKLKEFEKSDDENVLLEIAQAYTADNAKKLLEKILNINPNNEQALILLGKIYFNESEFEKSQNIFNIFPKTTDNPEVLNYLGIFATENMQFIDAIKYFSKALSVDKQNAGYFYNLGNAYFYNGWMKEAINAYKNSIRLQPDNLGYKYALAYLYYENKNFDKAQYETDFILKEKPDYTMAHILNALLKLENKDCLGAQKELEDNYNPDDNFLLVSLAKVYTELSLFEKARKSIQKAISNTPESLNYKCQLAQIYLAENNFDEALKITEEIISKNENYISAYSVGAKAALGKGDINKAKDFAQITISLDINYSEGYYNLALVRIREEDYDEAIECMKRALLYSPNNAEYYAKMSEIYRIKKDYKAAFDYIKEAENISESTEYRIIYKELAELNKKNLTKKEK